MKPDLKKLIITNLPYLLFVWLFGKVGAAYRLAAGTDLTQKLLHFMDSLAAAFSNGLPSFHPFDLCIGVAGGGAGAAGGLFQGQERQEIPPRHGIWQRTMECIILTVITTCIDAGGYANERLQ